MTTHHRPSGHFADFNRVFAGIKHPHFLHCLVSAKNSGQTWQIEYLWLASAVGSGSGGDKALSCIVFIYLLSVIYSSLMTIQLSFSKS